MSVLSDPAPSIVSDAPNDAVVEQEPVEEPDAGLADQDLEDEVDHVISDHGVVTGELESAVRSTLREVGFTEPVGRFDPPKVTPRPWDPSEVHLDDSILADRRQREQVLREMRPDIVRPHLDDPLVTRAGVFYVPPEFFQAIGIDTRMDAALLRSGLRSVRLLLQTPDSEVAAITGLSVREVARAKDDLDLTRLPGVDEATADLLRLAGIQSLSRLAATDPARVMGEIERLRKRHRFFDLPRVLRSEDAVRRLIDDAQGSA